MSDLPPWRAAGPLRVSRRPAADSTDVLGLARTLIGDPDLACLAGLRTLRHLDLSGTKVTDDGVPLPCAARCAYGGGRGAQLVCGLAGIPWLVGLTALRQLDLGFCGRISNVGVSRLLPLAACHSLAFLNVNGAKHVDGAALHALPCCEVKGPMWYTRKLLE